LSNVSGWHIYRAVRPMIGEAVLQLPKDVVVDLVLSLLPGGTDLLFVNGRVASTQGTGLVAVWVRDASKPLGQGAQLLVTVNSAGLLAIHPADPTNADPFHWARDGRDSGM
jgi:hypothetical protein